MKEVKREEKKKLTHHRLACLNNFVHTNVSLHSSAGSSTGLNDPGRVQIEFKVGKIATKILLGRTRRLCHNLLLISSLLPPSPVSFFFSVRESILNCTRTVFPFGRRFSEALKLAELLKRTRKREKLRSADRTIVKERTSRKRHQGCETHTNCKC